MCACVHMECVFLVIPSNYQRKLILHAIQFNQMRPISNNSNELPFEPALVSPIGTHVMRIVFWYILGVQLSGSCYCDCVERKVSDCDRCLQHTIQKTMLFSYKSAQHFHLCRTFSILELCAFGVYCGHTHMHGLQTEQCAMKNEEHKQLLLL